MISATPMDCEIMSAADLRYEMYEDSETVRGACADLHSRFVDDFSFESKQEFDNNCLQVNCNGSMKYELNEATSLDDSVGCDCEGNNSGSGEVAGNFLDSVVKREPDDWTKNEHKHEMCNINASDGLPCHHGNNTSAAAGSLCEAKVKSEPDTEIDPNSCLDSK